MDALRTISVGIGNEQNVQNARAAQAIASPRERDSSQPLQPEQSGVAPSVQVNLSETARAAARSDLSSPPPPMPANAPAAPIQTQDAVTRTASAGNTDRVENRDTAAGREAVQRYMETADNTRPTGQSAPSSVRVSA